MTTLHSLDLDRNSKERARYEQYITWTFWAAFIFGVMQLLAYIFFHVLLIGIAGVVTLGYGICLIGARALLRRGQTHAAIITSSIGLLVVALLLSFSLPIAIPAISILPLMAIAHSLPYLRGREIQLLIFISWFTAVIVISLDAIFPSTLGLPAWFSITFRISSFGAALGIVFLLLWQFTSRLTNSMQQIRAINADLETHAIQLTAANEELKQFASIVSHDLRAPLLNIRGFSKELRFAFWDAGIMPEGGNVNLGPDQLQALSDALEKDIPEALEFIDSSVNRMDGFLSALLKLSRLGRRELNPEHVDVEELVNETLKTLKHKIESNHVDIKVLDLPDTYADRIALEQIFGNILVNALNYLEPSRPGQIVVSARSGSGETIFSIQDNGRGIAHSDHNKIFTPLRRAGRQDVPGEGMGLAYVQSMVRTHNGTIWFESKPNIGTTFFFSISHSLAEDTNE